MPVLRWRSMGPFARRFMYAKPAMSTTQAHQSELRKTTRGITGRDSSAQVSSTCMQPPVILFSNFSSEWECGVPPRLPHADLKVNSYSYESQAHYECQARYSKVGGNSTKICSANRTWIGDDIVCKSCSPWLLSVNQLILYYYWQRQLANNLRSFQRQFATSAVWRWEDFINALKDCL